MTGRVLGHYRILDQIGAGGMGVVYRARDERLEREVALKVLPADALADEAARKRFRQEALAISKLNHPNIATAHDFDSQDGVDFLVMEYVKGTPLERKLVRGPFPPAEAVKLIKQLAEGLAAAHARGIVHRDLKPGNLLVTSDGLLKILDFGIAKLLAVKPAGDGSTVTMAKAEVIAGTLPYMAPEQVRGEEVDERTDIYAAGVVLYELLTGRRPFQTRTAAELSSEILRDPPTPVKQLRSEISDRLDTVVLKCLAKKPEERYESARMLGAALEAASRPSKGRAKQIAAVITVIVLAVAGFVWHRSRTLVSDDGPVTLAVLPFRILNADASTGHLGVGIPDALITRLANIRQVRVRPTSSVLRFETAPVEAREAGQALACDYLLTGTIQRAGDRYRVNVQLLRVRDGSALWGKAYDPPRSDLLGLQDALADQVVSALRIQLTAAERERVYRRYTQNAAAYELYLKGSSELQRRPENAIPFFNEALRLEKDYALAHAGKARACAQIRIFTAQPEEMPRWEKCAEDEAKRALGIAPELAEAHEAMAAVHRWSDFDWERTIQESDHALELNPSLHTPHRLRADSFRHLGLLDLVEHEVLAARENNPGGPGENGLLAVAALLDGRYTEALRMFTTAKGVEPSINSGQAMFYSGDARRAIDMLAGLHGVDVAGRRMDALRASFLVANGIRQEADQLLTPLLTDKYRDHHTAYSIGAAQAQLGNIREAVRWLRLAAQWGYVCYPWYSRDPLLAPLDKDEEFRQFMKEMQKGWETNKIRFGSQATAGVR